VREVCLRKTHTTELRGTNVKLFKISQNVNNGYDTYSEAIVACNKPEEAKIMNPGGFREWNGQTWLFKYANGTTSPNEDRTWCHPDHVVVELLGNAKKGTKKGVILASFHAG